VAENIYKQNFPSFIMPKRVTETIKTVKTVTTKKPGKSSAKSSAKVSSELSQKVIENLVDLQKIETNLAERFDKLSDQISRLLALFEMAARDFGKQPLPAGMEKDREFMDKINMLLEQNRTLAKGLMLMEERLAQTEQRPAPAPVYRPQLPPQQPQQAPPYFKPAQAGRPLPRF